MKENPDAFAEELQKAALVLNILAWERLLFAVHQILTLTADGPDHVEVTRAWVQAVELSQCPAKNWMTSYQDGAPVINDQRCQLQKGHDGDHVWGRGNALISRLAGDDS